MPHYKIHIKLQNDRIKEYMIEDERKMIDVVYADYKRRVYEKNGAGRVIYFDLVMVAEESLQHEADRKEVFNQENNFGTDDHINKVSAGRKKRREYKDVPTLGERAKKDRDNQR